MDNVLTHSVEQEQPSLPEATAPTPSTNASTVSAKPAPSKSRGPRRHVNLTQSTTLESLDDSMGPLGPLGAEPVEEPAAPTPPVKELASRTRSRPQTANTNATSTSEDDITHSHNGARQPPPVLPPQFDNRTRSQQPSMSVEQAAKPTFSITVGDPHTVGNAASSHTSTLR